MTFRIFEILPHVIFLVFGTLTATCLQIHLQGIEQPVIRVLHGASLLGSTFHHLAFVSLVKVCTKKTALKYDFYTSTRNVVLLLGFS